MKQSKIVILCIDGLDLSLVHEYIRKHRLPTIQRIARNGLLRSLSTVNPPQSPVVWESFLTGQQPEEHGVTDFFSRNLAYQLSPVFNTLRKEKYENAFWNWSEYKGVDIEMLFMPSTYPPPNTFPGKLISGMGVPDLLSRQGAFHLYTQKPRNINAGIICTLRDTKEQSAFIHGPDGISIPFHIRVINRSAVEITVQGKIFVLKGNELSNWITLEFRKGFWKRIFGMTQFALVSVNPLEIYVSAIEIHPQIPHIPISYPKEFVKQLGIEYGYFHTLGLPHANSSLRESVISKAIYLRQAEEIFRQRERLLIQRIVTTNARLLIGYIGSLDSIQHMFWEEMRGKKKPYDDVIEQYYIRLDKLLHTVCASLGAQDRIYILSDHGFGHFSYEVNLNNILKDLGYLICKSGDETKPMYENVDWKRTIAYAVGYNSIYINLEHREMLGTVSADIYEATIQELANALLKYRLPFLSKQCFKQIHVTKARGTDIPEIIVGYKKGYRTSWESCLGIVSSATYKKRKNAWSGDHMFDASEVPGVLLTNDTRCNVRSITNMMSYIGSVI